MRHPLQKADAWLRRACMAITLFGSLLPGVPQPAQAQGLEGWFSNAQRFLERQKGKLERQFGKDVQGGAQNDTASAPALVPPLPRVNPMRLGAMRPALEEDAERGAPLTGAAQRERGEISDLPALLPARKPQRAPAFGPFRDAARVPLPVRKPQKPPLTAQKPPPHPRDVARKPWTDTQIRLARTACEARLKGRVIAFEPLPPLQEGACGAPYPLRVLSVGRAPAVSLAPPAIMSCTMAASLHDWIAGYVQKAAAGKLGAPIVLIRNAASNVCRNRNDTAQGRISEHGRANALDIAAFVTADGTVISVLEDWGKAVLPEQERPVAGLTGKPQGEGPAVPGTPASPRRLFLQAAHSSACLVFGTVLGPDADTQHRDHLHLDAAPRRYGNYCR
ncbi:MAG: hypothetical protein Kow0032_25750 [Methyloligellaceae bacterium]